MTFLAFCYIVKRFSSKLFLPLLILFVLISPSAILKTHATNGAAFAIERAEGAVINAYQTISQVEQAGGGVEGLIDRITWALRLLDRAQVNFQSGNYNEAVYFADQCYGSALEIVTEATTALDAAIETSSQRVRLAAINSVIVSCVIVCVSFFVWHILVRRHYLRLNHEVGG